MPNSHAGWPEQHLALHPLKIICLLAWLTLLGLQLALLRPDYDISTYWIAILVVPLLVPIRGLINDRLYTYRWVGFLTLLYFCIGISELVANPLLRIYGIGCSVASLALFLASIYYARYLALHPTQGG